MTVIEMRQIEKHVETQRQLKVIRKAMIRDLATTCDECNLTFVAMYNDNGYELCPCCDEDRIEAHKKRHVKLSLVG